MSKAGTMRRDGRRGATIVEGALTLLVFLMLVFGLMDFGRAVYAYHWVCHAARAGARFAMVRGQASGRPAAAADVESAVLRQAIGLDRSAIEVTTLWLPDKAAGSSVEVQVRYRFQPLVPFIPPNAIPMQSVSRIEIAQ